MIRFCVLGSGSKGNSIFVEVGGEAILVDAGFNKKETSRRLSLINRSYKDIAGAVVTHCHIDHWCDNHRFPLAIPKTMGIATFVVSHDVTCRGYAISDKNGNKLVIIPDTGCVTDGMLAHMIDANAIIIETNYDVDMLANNKVYGSELLDRIASVNGHLRNECAAEAVGAVAWKGLKYVVGWHLSEKNNNQDLVKQLLDFAVNECCQLCEVVVSGQHEPTKIMTLI
jgi:phosphoribosyl 1,2-cyclic phosphodiesterase